MRNIRRGTKLVRRASSATKPIEGVVFKVETPFKSEEPFYSISWNDDTYDYLFRSELQALIERNESTANGTPLGMWVKGTR